MKKIIFTVMLVAFVSSGANAQFRFGVKGGVNFEDFDINSKITSQLKKDNFSSWDLGIVAQFPLISAFHLQPEVLYSSQKIDLTDFNDDEMPLHPMEGTSKISYFQVPVNLLCKIDLVAVNVFASGGVYFGYAVDRNHISASSLRKTDWGVSLGAGVEFMKFQVSARYNWALQNISDVKDIQWKSNRFNVGVAFFIL